ncbi:DUF4157 domain-containing protein [Dyella sp.]|uniref:eCIS core domain-containing protein n=1 Tax=Dyella sp. TaxID=1869338 RepID=UPI002ED61CCE
MKQTDPLQQQQADGPKPAAASSGMSPRATQLRVNGSQRQLAQHQAITQMRSDPERGNGLPTQLRAGIESLSGMDMGDVVVHRNSAQPAQMNAHAYAQGNQIHLGPGQEKHLPHEAWHVVQQRQGRVKATRQLAAVGVNDDPGLEREADRMGERAMQRAALSSSRPLIQHRLANSPNIAQLKTTTVGTGAKKTTVTWTEGKLKGSTENVGLSMTAKNLHDENVDVGDLMGSPPKASAQKNLMAKLPTTPKLRSTEKYIKGHLLNHNVGGPGEDYNLFPITASANSAHHSHVEKTVKKWILKDKQKVDYTVNVSVASDNSNAGSKSGTVNASFACSAKNTDTDETVTKTIASIYNSKATVNDGVTISNHTASDDKKYSGGSWFEKVYNQIAEEEDPDKVNEFVDSSSKSVVDWIRQNIEGDTAKKIVNEVRGRIPKRFTSNDAQAVGDVVTEALLAFALFNDHDAVDEMKADYPALIGLLDAS